MRGLTEKPPLLIDTFLPAFDVSERHAITVEADTTTVWKALWICDLFESRVVRWLFALRRLPTDLGSLGRGCSSLTLSQAIDNGFVLLAVDGGRELVLGLVGRVWRLRPGPRPVVDAGSFVDFVQPGYAKAVMNVVLHAQGDGRTVVETETRVHCTDAGARRRFRLYWTLVAPFSGLIRRELLGVIKRHAEAARSSSGRPV